MNTIRGDTTRTGLVIEHLERLTLSVNGNPRFRVHFTDGTAHRTMSDASLGYCIDNLEYRDVPLAVTFTAHGTIRRAVPEPPVIIGEPAWKACHTDVYRAMNDLEG